MIKLGDVSITLFPPYKLVIVALSATRTLPEVMLINPFGLGELMFTLFVPERLIKSLENALMSLSD